MYYLILGSVALLLLVIYLLYRILDGIYDRRVAAYQNKLLKNEVEVVIYEPVLESDVFDGYKVIHDLKRFKETADVIAANRITDELADVREKVYTRDIYVRD